MSKVENGWHRDHERRWEIKGILIGHQISTITGSSCLKVSKSGDLVRLHFGLAGDYRFTYHQLGQTYVLAGGHHNLMYSDGIDLVIENKTAVVETFGVSFPRAVFLELMEGEYDFGNGFIAQVKHGQSAIYSDVWGTIHIGIQQLLDQILVNPYQGQLERVYIYGKVHELLVLCLQDYRKVRAMTSPYISDSYDRERIIAARDFLNRHLSNPPNLAEVARFAGLNVFKLKRGFKEMFGSTVFGYLRTRRLDLARQLLISDTKEISQIAEDLGYSSPQHFHNQFKKHFGVTPKNVKKNP